MPNKQFCKTEVLRKGFIFLVLLSFLALSFWPGLTRQPGLSFPSLPTGQN